MSVCFVCVGSLTAAEYPLQSVLVNLSTAVSAASSASLDSSPSSFFASSQLSSSLRTQPPPAQSLQHAISPVLHPFSRIPAASRDNCSSTASTLPSLQTNHPPHLPSLLSISSPSCSSSNSTLCMSTAQQRGPLQSPHPHSHPGASNRSSLSSPAPTPPSTSNLASSHHCSGSVSDLHLYDLALNSSGSGSNNCGEVSSSCSYSRNFFKFTGTHCKHQQQHFGPLHCEQLSSKSSVYFHCLVNALEQYGPNLMQADICIPTVSTCTLSTRTST